jgi:hypothetical protein
MRLNSTLSLLFIVTYQSISAQLYYRSQPHLQLTWTVNHYTGIDYSFSANTIRSAQQLLIDNKIASQETETTIKGRKSTITSIKYNKKGLVTSIQNEYFNLSITYDNDTLINYFHQQGKKKTTEAFYIYDSVTKQLISLKEFVNDKLFFEIERTYNKEGVLIYESEKMYDNTYELLRKYNEYGKLVFEKIKTKNRNTEMENQYNENHLLIHELKRSGRKFQNTYEIKHTYDTHNQKTKTEYYKNGNLSHVWNYDCSEKGELLSTPTATSVSQNSSCSWKEENNDNSFITYNRTIRNKEVLLSKSYFTADSIFYKREEFKNETQLVYAYTKTTSSTLKTRYNKKGKQASFELILFNEQQAEKYVLKNYFYFFKNKLHETENTYNSEGLITRKTITQNGKPIRTLIYRYSH